MPIQLVRCRLDFGHEARPSRQRLPASIRVMNSDFGRPAFELRDRHGLYLRRAYSLDGGLNAAPTGYDVKPLVMLYS
jgi:hypothetical protein